MYWPDHYNVNPPSVYDDPDCPCERGEDCPAHGPVEPWPDEPNPNLISAEAVA